MTPWTQRNDEEFRWWHNKPFLIIMVYLTIVLVMSAFGLWKLKEQNDRLHTQAVDFASRICVTSNDARHALYDLLDFAEVRAKQQGKLTNAPQEQIDQAIDFYEAAKKRIHFTSCPPPLG